MALGLDDDCFMAAPRYGPVPPLTRKDDLLALVQGSPTAYEGKDAGETGGKGLLCWEVPSGTRMESDHDKRLREKDCVERVFRCVDGRRTELLRLSLVGVNPFRTNMGPMPRELIPLMDDKQGMVAALVMLFGQEELYKTVLDDLKAIGDSKSFDSHLPVEDRAGRRTLYHYFKRHTNWIYRFCDEHGAKDDWDTFDEIVTRTFRAYLFMNFE